MAEYQKAYRLANRERIAKLIAEWRKRNPEKEKEYSATWRKRNPEKAKAYTQQLRDTIHDSYARKALARGTSMKQGDVPQLLVDVQLELMKLKRAINEKL
jgi:plasmid stabilization system protein ParE